jgi:NodT family efflux transporter outer membrane factor (OMF) lipoprotein
MAAGLLAACTNLPPADPDALPGPVPAAWSTGQGGTPTQLAAWWERFNDPQLTALVTRALQANTDVRSARAALLQARALRDVKAATLSPQVNATGSAQRAKSGAVPASNSFAAGFDASWEPDVFGGVRSAVNATEADAQAAQASLGNVQVSMTAEVAVTYIGLRGQQAQLQIARSNLASQTETLQIARWRVQAGLASALDVEQATTAAEQTRAQIPVLETSAAQSLSSLAVLTGQAPGAMEAAVRAPALVPQPADTLALAIPAETLRQRPDVQAAERRIRAALARVAQADAARYPRFQISGSLGLRALSLGALGNGAAVANALLASVSLPVVDAGAARAQVRAQQAALEQARVAYEAAVLTTLKDVEDALAALQGDRERLARLQAASDAAANADLLAQQRYRSGLIDFLTVLETQRALLSTQDSVAATRASVSADHVRLYKALGGGWTPGAEAAAP